jgi:ribonuclease Z
MFELIFLGTSASVPSADRNQPGLLISANGTRILVDCGEGTQRQLLRSGLGFRQLGRLLLTHGHLDHVLGITGLLSTLGLQQSSEGMIINGGARTLETVSRILAGHWGEGRSPIPLTLAPISQGQVAQENGFTITAFPVRHRDTDSYGYSFQPIARRHLQRDRLVALDVPDGAIRRELAAGRSTRLADGRTIEPADVLGPLENGRKLVVVGDTETTDGLRDFVQDAAILVIEATFIRKDRAMAKDYGHLTAEQAAFLAASSGVDQLILTHISGRYAAEDILAEAREIFPSTHIANDLDRFKV